MEIEFIGFGVGIDDIRNPPVAWKGTDTFIQIKGVNNDFGIYDDPEGFYTKPGPNFRGVRRLLFKYIVRHVMNAKVCSIRAYSDFFITSLDNDAATSFACASSRSPRGRVGRQRHFLSASDLEENLRRSLERGAAPVRHSHSGA